MSWLLTFLHLRFTRRARDISSNAIPLNEKHLRIQASEEEEIEEEITRANNFVNKLIAEQNDDDVVKQISDEDRLHLSALHAGCMSHKETIIPWTYGQQQSEISLDRSPEGEAIINQRVFHRGDPDLNDHLGECPDIDIFLPSGIRSFGYCEDGSAYAKYLQSRLLPRWVFTDKFFDHTQNRNVSYHDLCPTTPLLFFNHYWANVTDLPEWPSRKPVYLMPNIEMKELGEQGYRRADVVLCKAEDCYRRVRRWYSERHNHCHTRIFYTKHTTSDVATAAIHALGGDHIQPKNFEDVRFLHVAGGSFSKGTKQVLDCWLSRPDLPPVDVYLHEWIYNIQYRRQYAKKIRQSSNVVLHTKIEDATRFGQRMAETAFFLCPSQEEGYGHYINQARAAGGVIISTDLAPMNELITPETGVLVNAEPTIHSELFLGGGFSGKNGLSEYPGTSARFSFRDLCQAVDFVLQPTTIQNHQRLARRVQQHYAIDTLYFAEQMLELRAHARRNPRRQCG